MQVHDIKPKTKKDKRKRVGRGGKRGTYCGKGVKGQKARAGRTTKPVVREILKRYPKVRGYKFSPLGKMHVVNISALDKAFKSQEEVTPQTLVSKKLIKKSKKYPVKILGKGETKKKLIVKDCLVSKSAKEKLEKAGGKVITDNQETNTKQ